MSERDLQKAEQDLALLKLLEQRVQDIEAGRHETVDVIFDRVLDDKRPLQPLNEGARKP
jgi:hypothetical protein